MAATGFVSSAYAAAPLVTETFDGNTDGYWGKLNNTGGTAGANDYKWSNTDNTGTAVNPPGGTATGAGEFGGTFDRVSSPANFYGFNVGSIDPFSEAFQASGVLHFTGVSGGSGFNLGFFAGADSFATGGDPANFIGTGFADGGGAVQAQSFIYSAGQGRDRSGDTTVATIPLNTTVAFEMVWTPLGGPSEKGVLDVVVNGVAQQVTYGGDVGNIDLLTHFGVLGISADGGNITAFFDDLTFSSYNPLGGLPGWKDVHGDWLVSSNWVGGIPNAQNATATFGANITQDRVVFANDSVTAGTLTFNNANSYLLTGHGTLTLNSTGTAIVDVQQGDHKINLPLVVASNTSVNVAAGATLKVSDPVTVNPGMQITPGGGGGALIFESTITLGAGAGISFDSSQHVAALTVGDNAKATMLPNSGRVLEADSLNISATGGKLDLTDNKMIFRNQGPGTFTAGAYTGPSGLVDSGRGAAGNALWDGSGIVTSDTRAINNGDLVSIGVAQVSDVRGIAATATTTFAGQNVAGSDTIAMVTWGGDANLDGKINIDDYGRIDGNVGQSGSVFGWSKGDFNYDGKINIDDYGIIDGNINRQGTPFSTAGAVEGVAAVPEPAGIALLALGAVASIARRRRRA